MSIVYETDVAAWAAEQASLLRAGRFSELDIEHIADEVEDVGKSERRELSSRMAVLLAHLAKWRDQPAGRGRSWANTIRVQRKSILLHLKQVPSLHASLGDAEWLEGAWTDAVALALRETGLEAFPDACPWSVAEVLSEDFLPD